MREKNKRAVGYDCTVGPAFRKRTVGGLAVRGPEANIRRGPEMTARGSLQGGALPGSNPKRHEIRTGLHSEGPKAATEVRRGLVVVHQTRRIANLELKISPARNLSISGPTPGGEIDLGRQGPSTIVFYVAAVQNFASKKGSTAVGKNHGSCAPLRILE